MGGAQQGARQAEQAALAGKQGQQLLHGVANEAVAGVGLGGCDALQGVVALQVGGGLPGALQGGQMAREQIRLRALEQAGGGAADGRRLQALVKAGAGNAAVHGALDAGAPARAQPGRGDGRSHGRDARRLAQRGKSGCERLDALPARLVQCGPGCVAAKGGQGGAVVGVGGLLVLQGGAQRGGGGRPGRCIRRWRRSEGWHGFLQEWRAGPGRRRCPRPRAGRARLHQG